MRKPGKKALRQQRDASDIKYLRHIADGFTAADGYDLRYPIHPSRLKRARKLAAYFRELSSRPVKLVRPRSESSKRVVSKHTRQKVRGQRVYFVPVQSVDSKVVVTRGKKPTVKIERKTKRGGKVFEQYFYLPHPPEDFDDIVAMTETMLEDMPDGYYSLVNDTHGLIGTAYRKEFLLEELDRFWLVYDTKEGERHSGLSQTITGYALLGNTFDDVRAKAKARRLEREAWKETQQRTKLFKRKTNKKCVKCGKPVKKGKSLCSKCKPKKRRVLR